MEHQRRFYEIEGDQDDYLGGIYKAAASYPFETQIDDFHVKVLWILDREFKKNYSPSVKNLLTLSALEIFREISFFTLMVEAYKPARSTIEYSDDLTKAILQGLHDHRYSFPRDRLAQLMGRDNFLRKNLKKTLGGTFLKVKKYTKGGYIYRGNANKLSMQVDVGNHDSILPILNHVIQRPISRPIKPQVLDFMKYLSEVLMVEVETYLGTLPDQLRSYVESMLCRQWQETWEDMNFPFHKYIDDKKGCFLSGTSGNYYDRLISYAFQRHSLKVIRFGHGGDRGLFDDFSWEVTDLAFVDVYVSHGRGESEVLSNRTSGSELPSISDIPVNFIDFGSDYHRSILEMSCDKMPHKMKNNAKKNVVIGAPAFSGIGRTMPYIKPHDFVCLDVQAKTLDIVNKLGYKAIVKRHPKGKLTMEKVYGYHGAEEIFSKGFIESTTMADVYVFSVAGSAFIEALCTMKPVVLLNIPYRPFNKEVFKVLRQCCEIVDVDLDDYGRVYIDLPTVSRAIESPVDVNKRYEFLQGHLFDGRFNRDDFNVMV